VKLSFEYRGADYKVCRLDAAMANTAGRDGWLRRRATATAEFSRAFIVFE
jgi:hypothetical protein